MIKNILVAVDASEYSVIAAECAFTIAQATKASLTFLHVSDIRIIEGPLVSTYDGYNLSSSGMIQMDDLRAVLDNKARLILNKMFELAGKAGFKANLEKTLAVPSSAIAEATTGFDLVVMGERGEGSQWGGAMLGSTVERVAREGSKPLLVTGKTSIAFKKCLVAFDGSKHSHNSLLFAIELCTSLGAILTVLTVSNHEEERKQREEMARGLLCGASLVVEVLSRTGDDGPTIVKVANELDVDFIVMGAFGHSRVREAIIGSTTVEVMRKADQPVLLVK